MTTARRYALVLPGPPGSHAPSRVVNVAFTGEFTPDGFPVYADPHSGLRVEVHGGAAKVLGTSEPLLHTCLQAVLVA
ncbi:DUF6296 family protein [Kitasatospora terrestris]|uniref:Uncharacterized protein n=1 Tax=Kitasatospora terrestris TaxID=258051 RepID=A0ABP9EPW5_9ACTN